MEHEQAVRALGALAQSSRLAIFRSLVEAGPDGLTVGAIGEALAVAPATLSFHLKELANAALVRPRQEGRFIHYSTDYASMAELMAYLTDNCCRGMPQACFAELQAAVANCCQPRQPRSSRRRSTSRSPS